jgi:hypothetical protein
MTAVIVTLTRQFPTDTLSSAAIATFVRPAMYCEFKGELNA